MSIYGERSRQMPKYSRVYLEITNICNRSCSFCPGTARAPKRLDMEEFSYLANSLMGLTDYLYFHVMGEPLTHPLLADFIKYAGNIGFKCAITTNGTLLRKRAEELLSSGVYKVNISVHSFEEGSEGEYASYIEDILDFADRASRAGILTVLRLWNKGCDGGRNDRTLDKIKGKFGEDFSFSERGARIRDKLHLEYGERFEWPDSEAELGSDKVFCYGLKDHFGILSDGRVIPCCLDREGQITLGNAFDTPINDIITSERARKIREGFMKRCASEELCRRCGYARRFSR